MPEHGVGQLARRREPPGIERRLVELQHAGREVGIVFKIAVQLGPPIAPRAPEPAIGTAQLAQRKLAGADRHVAVVGAIQHPGRVGQRRQHQAVPRREHLVIQPGPDAVLAPHEQCRTPCRQPRLDVVNRETVHRRHHIGVAHPPQDGLVLPVAVPRHVIRVAEERRVVAQ